VYQRLPSWVLGFHGTDEDTAHEVLNNPRHHVKTSDNPWDWLGPGAYFWENDPVRAHQFSIERMKWAGITDKKPAVIGAIIDLGHCLNLFDQPALGELRAAYLDMKKDFELLKLELPQNEGPTSDLVYRNLDRAVFQHLHQLRTISHSTSPYQTVRSPFMEGKELYENTLFRQKNHIQIAVIDHSCIKGYFLRRDGI
jgi:hypothetical protein